MRLVAAYGAPAWPCGISRVRRTALSPLQQRRLVQAWGLFSFEAFDDGPDQSDAVVGYSHKGRNNKGDDDKVADHGPKLTTIAGPAKRKNARTFAYPPSRKGSRREA